MSDIIQTNSKAAAALYHTEVNHVFVASDHIRGDGAYLEECLRERITKEIVRAFVTGRAELKISIKSVTLSEYQK